MKTLRLLILVFMFCAEGLVSQVFCQTVGEGQTNFVPVRVRGGFNGNLRLKTREKQQEVPVSLYFVAIENRQTVNGVKELKSGLALIQFGAGKMQTQLNGKTEHAQGGEFLVIPPGSTPVFSTEDDTASFTAVVFGDPIARASATLSETNLIPSRLERFEQTEGGPLRMQSLAPVKLGEFELQVQTLQVGPSRSTRPFHLPGAALLQITSGKGKLAINEKSTAIHGGMFVTVAEGETLKFTNERSDLGLSIRATILGSR